MTVEQFEPVARVITFLCGLVVLFHVSVTVWMWGELRKMEGKTRFPWSDKGAHDDPPHQA